MISTDALVKRRSHALLKKFRAEPPKRTPSLLVTLFGDVVESHGGEIWLGSLVRLLEPLGISERLVRTSVYRLAQEGWIEGIKAGRRRYYRLTESAKSKVVHFDRRIYYPVEQQWDGQWRLVFTGTREIDADQRADLRKRLAWMGFGVIAPNVYAHPTVPVEPVWAIVDDMGITDRIVVMRARSFDQLHGLSTREMARQCFELEGLESEYTGFIERYGPLARAVENDAGPACICPAHCFTLRTMLIHQFRKVLFKDPDLPAALLPDPWTGAQARRICGRIYQRLLNDSEQFIQSVCEDRDGFFTDPGPRYLLRFSEE